MELLLAGVILLAMTMYVLLEAHDGFNRFIDGLREIRNQQKERSKK